MDLTEAFGSAFAFSGRKGNFEGFPSLKKIGATSVQTSPPGQQSGAPSGGGQSGAPNVAQSGGQSGASGGQSGARSGSQSGGRKPEVYVLHVQIGRDDCHLLCLFLLIFSVSFILSSRG